MIIFSIIVFTILGAIYLYYNMRLAWYLNPAVWFIITQLRYSFGILPLLNCEIFQEDLVLLVAMITFFICFIAGTLVSRVKFNNHLKLVNLWENQPINIQTKKLFSYFIQFAMVVSISICVIYYYKIGYILFWDGIKALFVGESLENVASLRLYAYAGDVYFAPGYVNQFKNCILPVLSYYFVIKSIMRKDNSKIFMSLFVIPVVIIFLLGTGQRSPFVLCAVSFCIFVLAVFPAHRIQIVSVFLIFLLVLFVVSSAIIGRGSQSLSSTSDLFYLIAEIFNRLFNDNQISAVAGFRIIYRTPTVWGAEWLESIKQMIPGFKNPNYIALESIIFSYFYGSTRGTAPLSLVGSSWYNFHIFGITVFPFVLGFLYQSIYYRIISSPKDLFMLSTFSSLTAILGLWGAGGPNTLLNKGLVGVLLLLTIGKLLPHKKRHQFFSENLTHVH